MSQEPRPLVSVVLSFRNEAPNIQPLVNRLDRMFTAEPVDYELIFVNDASTDDSLAVLIRERESNRHIKIVNLSRRFGVAEGVRAGMAAAKGAVVVYMDADLQDPPELIPALLAQWRTGAQVVHTVRTHRHGEGKLKMWMTRRAYELIKIGATIVLPVNAGDFKLLSREVVNHLLELREADPYLRGLVVWLGFRQVLVNYERESRSAGKTHFPLFSRNPWKTVLLGMTSFSFMPIYVSGIVALIGLFVAFLILGAAAVLWYFDSVIFAQAALTGLLTFFWATILVAISTVGLYVARIYKDVRGRPQYIVESRVGFAEGDQTGRGLSREIAIER